MGISGKDLILYKEQEIPFLASGDHHRPTHPHICQMQHSLKSEQEKLKDFTSSTLCSTNDLLVRLEINFYSQDTPLLEVEEGKELGSCAVLWSNDSHRDQPQGLLTCSGNSSSPAWDQEGSPLEIGTSVRKLFPSATALNIAPC